ncbi:hypothetical protein F751_5361 [Auxenochlorella protothecoides]|uniref:Uncharacterized protein n=1 Tax=Auxenochlorella protothecoides TaxID=3075 RepID=A0A087SRU4_AUXPR|nr:hypothetical protein F751_5361 [Auxenochlorella protothecoides]KFM28448.1 hypothetical protein F751_5361 [Auxenochlorella protothecoides]
MGHDRAGDESMSRVKWQHAATPASARSHLLWATHVIDADEEQAHGLSVGPPVIESTDEAVRHTHSDYV